MATSTAGTSANVKDTRIKSMHGNLEGFRSPYASPKQFVDLIEILVSILVT